MKLRAMKLWMAYVQLLRFDSRGNQDETRAYHRVITQLGQYQYGDDQFDLMC